MVHPALDALHVVEELLEREAEAVPLHLALGVEGVVEDAADHQLLFPALDEQELATAIVRRIELPGGLPRRFAGREQYLELLRHDRSGGE